MSKSLVEPGVGWVQCSPVWAGRECWKEWSECFKEDTATARGRSCESCLAVLNQLVEFSELILFN